MLGDARKPTGQSIRFYRRERRKLLVAIGGIILLGLGTAGARVAHDRAPISAGDYVVFHFDAVAPDGQLLYTSDPDTARREIDAGNRVLDENVSARHYGPRAGYVVLHRQAPGDGASNASFQPSRFILGYREGDVVVTPYVVNPYGSARSFAIPNTIGPLETEVELDLSALYDERNASTTSRLLGPRENLTEGALVPYAEVLTATVLDIEGDRAHLKIEAAGGDRVFSRVLGFNLTIEPIGGGRVLLHPELAAGDVFKTQGCRLPLELPPGRYRVERATGDVTVVKEAPAVLEHLLDTTLQFRIRVIDVDKWASLRRIPDEVGRLVAALGSVAGGRPA